MLLPLKTTASLEGVRVLLVEDDPTLRDVLRVVLEMRKATVQAVGSASEAIAAFSVEKPDVIVSDIGLPEESGHSLIRKLRALESPGFPRIPAVALTGFDQTKDRLAAIGAGFQIHVSKPVAPDELVTIVATFAGRPG